MKENVVKRLKNELKYGNVKQFFRIAVNYIELYIKKNDFCRECQIIEKMLPNLNEEYDIAISYHAPSTIPMFYLIDRMVATKKIVWIHGDVEKTKSVSRLCKTYYEQYDEIVCVSKEAESVFVRNFPELKNKTQMIYNIIDKKQIIKLAKESISEKLKKDAITIVTVGRLSIEKGIDIAIETCYELIKKGYLLQWFVCGDGAERKALEEKILEYGLTENFILLGNKENPYPYIKQCDIYVQPSRHEGYCLALAEARILCKPIVTTDFAGAREQLGNDKGMIVSCDVDALELGIEKMIRSNDIKTKYVEALKKDLAADDSLIKIKKLFDGV